MTHASAISWQELTLELVNPFRLSYGTSETRQVFWLRLGEDEGWGEAAIPPYYGVDPSAIIYHWQQIAAMDASLPDEPLAVPDWVRQVEGPKVAYAALEIALFDRIARLAGQPLWQLFELPEPRPKVTSVTIAIDTPGGMARLAREMQDRPIIKVKLGEAEQDIERLEAIRAARPDARLYVDANAGWKLEQALGYLARLEQLGVDMLEQPLGRDEIAGMGKLQSETSIPVVADESVLNYTDVEHLADVGVKGINLKLMKIGGFSRTIAMANRAKELDLRIMLGSMIETSIGVTAMAHLIGLADWLDLDVPLLTRNDPFVGITYTDKSEVVLPEGPGLAVRRRS